jgi:hypothetical protein
VGAAVARDRPGLAIGLGARDAVHGAHSRGQTGDLHHERDRGAQPAATKGSQDKGALPQRGCRKEAHLPRDPERRPAMDADPRLDKGAARVQDPLRRPTTRLNPSNPAYTVRRTPSLWLVAPLGRSVSEMVGRWAAFGHTVRCDEEHHEPSRACCASPLTASGWLARVQRRVSPARKLCRGVHQTRRRTRRGLGVIA